MDPILPKYRPAQVIENSLRWYATNAPAFARYILLRNSFEERPISALRLRFGGGSLPRPAVLILAGLHGNELMVPDLLMDFVEQLFFTRGPWPIDYFHVVPDTFPPNQRFDKRVKVWDAAAVEKIRQALDIVILPLANPDGRQRVLENRATATNRGRKNGRGVDLNRNFSLPVSHGIRQNGGGSGSGGAPDPARFDPSSETYAGPVPFSEVESRNIRDLLATHPFECLIDMHMGAEAVFYPWGHAPTQTTDAVASNYMNPSDIAKFASVGQASAAAMNLVGGGEALDLTVSAPNYQAGHIHALYRRASGSALDYAFTATAAGPHPVYGFALEIGKNNLPPSAPVTSADFSGKFLPQASMGLLTILKACAQRAFALGGVARMNALPRYSNVYQDAVKDIVPIPRVEP